MDLDHQFEIPADLDTTWPILLDIPRIAPCLPGAELTEIIGPRHFKGTAKIKIGPIALQFAGEAEIVEIDDKNHSASIVARGADAKGRGNAQANITFKATREDGGQTRVTVHSDINLTGAIAQYGRASGLIDEIAKQLISDFVANLKKEIERAPDSPQAGGDAETAVAAKPAAGQAISGLSLFFRALTAMIKRWFGRG